jgi:putative membrane-bound dehydrogenase-like protein
VENHAFTIANCPDKVILRFAMKYLWPLVILGFACSVFAQDRPIPPAESAQEMTVPAGFHVSLFAGEPSVVQPIAFTFDDRGRVWVVECLSYPNWRFDGTGNDRVIMFEDTNGDGSFDVRHVVFDKGANLSGIELGHGGIWLCSAPHLVFLPCDFNSEKPTPQGKPEIVLDGWNIKDTKHNVFNSLIWGPDGWLYGCNGIQAKSQVGRPGSNSKERVEINCGVWRYHPIKKKFEAVCHGTTNPFGLDYDEYGELFITNCVIKHLFHVIPGAHYDRMYGQDINPHSYALMHSIADYIHWAGGDWTTSRGGQGAHSDAGGGHAHVGAVVYLGDNFPEEYRNTLLTCNLHGNRLNRDVLRRKGSGYKSERAADFLFANDTWFRGIAVKSGPDGAVYVSDWCDTGECHNYEKADTTNGRIHKVTYGRPKPQQVDLAKSSIAELIALQSHKNDWLARHARRILHERAEAGERQQVVSAAIQYRDTSDGVAQLRLDWLLHTIGETTNAIAALAKSEDNALGEVRRAWAIRVLLENVADGTNRDLRPDSPELALRSPAERLAFASGLQRIRPEDRLEWAMRLLAAIGPEDASDQNLPLMTWYAVEPIVGIDWKNTERLVNAAQIPLVREFIARKAIGANRDNINALLGLAADTKDTSVARDMLQGILDGLGGVRQTPMPPEWKTAGPALLVHTEEAVSERAMALAVTFGDETAIAAMKAKVKDTSVAKSSRTTALRVLLGRGKPDLLPMLKELFDDDLLRPDAIRGLAGFDDQETPALLLKAYPLLTSSEKEDAVQTMASRPSWALALLDAIAADAIPRRDVSVFVARQMNGIGDKRVSQRLAEVWGQLQPASARRTELTARYQKILTDDQLSKADLSNGRLMFAKNCASCHRLYDDGGDAGPGLTGSQRSNLDYLLENILDPSAVVPNEYKMTVLQLDSGRTINGIITKETDSALTVRTANETLVVPKNEIDLRMASNLSIMPEGILEKLTDNEVQDLVAYLRSKEQTPLPIEAKP